MEPFWSHMPLRPYFEIDGVTLYHGDCRDVLPELPAESFDMVLTDPPYLVSYTGRWGKHHEPIVGDSDPSWVHPAFCEIWRVLKRDSLCLSFYGWTNADIFLGTWKEIGYRPVSHIAVLKVHYGFGTYARTQHATAYLLAKGTPQRPVQTFSDVLVGELPSPLVHPNQKPIGPISQLITTFAPATGLVLDPFAGSGTTLIAARAVGRRAIGVEVDERFCEVVALRLFQQTFNFIEQIEPPQQLELTSESHLVDS